MSRVVALRIAGVGTAPTPRPLAIEPTAPSPTWPATEIRSIASHCADQVIAELRMASAAHPILAAVIKESDALRLLSRPGALAEVASVAAATGDAWKEAVQILRYTAPNASARYYVGRPAPGEPRSGEQLIAFLGVLRDALAAGHHADLGNIATANDALRAAVVALDALDAGDEITMSAMAQLLLPPYAG